MSLHTFMAPQAGRSSSKTVWKILGMGLSVLSIALAVAGLIAQLPPAGLTGLSGIVFSLIVGLLGLRMAVLWSKELFASEASIAAPQPSMNYASMHSNFGRPDTAWENNGLLNANHYTSSLQPTYTPAFAYAQADVPQPLFPQHSGYDIPPQQPANNPIVMYNAAPPVPYTPIDQDELFQLDAPVNGVLCFILPKEGELMVECQDRYALNTGQKCYAVADGVAGSFVAGPWARIVSKSFVKHGGNFTNEGEFKQWLTACSEEWHRWMENRWVPTMNAMRARSGDRPGDWSNDIRLGAQTTLIGCSLYSSGSLRKSTHIARVFAIGDGEFFHFRPNDVGAWDLMQAFPYQQSSQFGSRPNTLMTMLRPDLLEHTWMSKQTLEMVSVKSGDRIVLTSDTLARWLLTQIEQQTNRWQPLLSFKELHDFEEYIREELHQGRIEDDDLTMLVIPV